MRSTVARRRVVFTALVAGLMLGGLAYPAAARAQPDSARAERDRSTSGVPVVSGTDTLFWLFGSLGPFSAGARAAAVGDRLGQVASALAHGDSIAVAHPLRSERAVDAPSLQARSRRDVTRHAT